MLFDVYVRTHMTFAASIWVPEFLRVGAPTPAGSPLGCMTAYYRWGLRTLLGLHYTVRTTVIYVVTVRWPLEVVLTKAIWRYFRRTAQLRTQTATPPVATLTRWAAA